MILKGHGVKIVNSGLDFLFHFYFYFSIFRTTRVRGYQSHCHISHKTDHGTQKNGVEDSRIK